MPIYEYQCEECRRVTEFLVRRVSGKPDRLVCEHCGSGRLKRAPSTIAVRGSASASTCSTGTCTLNKP